MPPAVARSFKVLIPIIITTIFFSVLNYFVKMAAPGGLHELIYSIIQTPLTRMSQSLLFLYWHCCPNRSGQWESMDQIRLRPSEILCFLKPEMRIFLYYADKGTTWGAPYPITYSGLATAFSEYVVRCDVRSDYCYAYFLKK